MISSLIYGWAPSLTTSPTRGRGHTSHNSLNSSVHSHPTWMQSTVSIFRERAPWKYVRYRFKMLLCDPTSNMSIRGFLCWTFLIFSVSSIGQMALVVRSVSCYITLSCTRQRHLYTLILLKKLGMLPASTQDGIFARKQRFVSQSIPMIESWDQLHADPSYL